MRMRMDEHFEYFFPYLFLIDFTNKSRIKILCNISLLRNFASTNFFVFKKETKLKLIS